MVDQDGGGIRGESGKKSGGIKHAIKASWCGLMITCRRIRVACSPYRTDGVNQSIEEGCFFVEDLQFNVPRRMCFSHVHWAPFLASESFCIALAMALISRLALAMADASILLIHMEMQMHMLMLIHIHMRCGCRCKYVDDADANYLVHICIAHPHGMQMMMLMFIHIHGRSGYRS